jgi:hypothetical protein
MNDSQGKQRKVFAAIKQWLKDYHRETVALNFTFPVLRSSNWAEKADRPQ